MSQYMQEIRLISINSIFSGYDITNSIVSIYHIRNSIVSGYDINNAIVSIYHIRNSIVSTVHNVLCTSGSAMGKYISTVSKLYLDIITPKFQPVSQVNFLFF